MQVFFSGSEISGVVKVGVADAKTNYKHIQISLKGKGVVKWTQNTTDTGVIVWTSDESYVNQRVEVWNRNQTPDGKFPPGTYDYPFTFLLPERCPSSFERQKGSIKYYLEAEIASTTPFSDHSVTYDFKVCNLVDVSKEELQVPVEKIRQKDIGFWKFKAGDVMFTTNIPRTGYSVSGSDSIPLRAFVENRSSRSLTMKAALIQNIKYVVVGNTTSEKKQIVSISSEEIKARTNIGWKPDNFNVPRDTDVTMNESHVINVSYILEIWADIPWARNAAVSIPIVLGN